MLLSALLTSVGINFGLCVMFFVLYDILRRQPVNVPVYAPRRLLQKKQEQEELRPGQWLDLAHLLPSGGWIRSAWSLTEDDLCYWLNYLPRPRNNLLASSGLDGVVLDRIFVFSVRVFTVAVVIGMFVLVPVNFVGDQLAVDFSDFTNKSLDSFSISNVNDGSKWLWFHFCAAYVFTGVVCYLLQREGNYISLKRISTFYASKPQPEQFTLLVRSIPASSERSIGDVVESFFTDYHPSTYLSYTLVHEASRVRGLMKTAEKLHAKLVRAKSKNHPQEKTKRDGFLGIVGPKVNILEYYENKLQNLEEKVTEQQLVLGNKPLPAAFVSFKSRFGAAVALNIRQGVDPTKWSTEEAPEPRDIHWQFFSTNFLERWARQIVAIVAFITVTILFLAAVVFVQGLANLTQLETWFPFLDSILSLTVVSQLVTGYLPSLILQAFMFFVPPTMIFLSSFQGYISVSQIERSACLKVLLFTIWNIFFGNVLSGSALYDVNVFLEPKNIPAVLAAAVPAQASFFISYVVTSGWTSLSSELFRSVTLIITLIRRILPGKDVFQVPSNKYYSEIPKILFLGLLGVTYFFLAPLILPFILVYFCMGYIIFRNQMINVYEPKYETNGRYWTIVHNSTIFSLLLMHIIAIGIFGLKELPLAASLTIPLPILTLLFNEYCRRRLQPNFESYPTECLVNKDKEIQSDPSMAEFYDSLVNAYKDPAFKPVQFSGNSNTLSAPLLQVES